MKNIFKNREGRYITTNIKVSYQPSLGVFSRRAFICFEPGFTLRLVPRVNSPRYLATVGYRGGPGAFLRLQGNLGNFQGTMHCHLGT